MPNESKCECVGIKEMIKWSVVDTSQKDNESSLDHTKQFKRAKDVFESTLGKGLVDEFVENTVNHADATDNTERKESKAKEHKQMMA